MNRTLKTLPLTALSAFLAVIMAVTPLSGAQVGSLPPDPQEMAAPVQEVINTADLAIGGIEPTGLISPTTLQANAVQAALEQKLNALKALYISGQLELIDYEDLDLDDIAIREGVLPERMFFHTDLFEDLGIVLPSPPAPPGGGRCDGNVDSPGDGQVESKAPDATNAGSGGVQAGGRGDSCSSAGVPDGSNAPSGVDFGGAQAVDNETRQRLHEADLVMRQFVEQATAYTPGNASGDVNVTQAAYDPPQPPIVNDLMAPQSAALGTLFSDDFNDNSLNPTKWTIVNPGYSILEKNSRLEITVREQQNTLAILRGSNVGATFDSSNGVEANVKLARHISGNGDVARPDLRVVSSDGSKWIRLYYDPFYGVVRLSDSLGTVQTVSNNGDDTGFHNFRIIVTGNTYTGYYDGISRSAATTLFNGVSSFRIELQVQTGGSSTGYLESSAHDDVVVYPYTTGGGNSAPNAPSQPSGPSSGQAGTSYSYSANAADPNGDSVRYQFDWGDGSAYSTTGYVSSGTAASASHTWGATGTYSVYARAQDSAGAYGSWSTARTVTIGSGNSAPGTPTQPNGPMSGSVGTAYSYLTSASDPDGNTVRYLFDWGDGTTTWTNYVGSGSSASASKTWGTTGTYQVRAQAQDSLGATSGWSSAKEVTISGSSAITYSQTFDAQPFNGWTLTGRWQASTCNTLGGGSLLYNGAEDSSFCGGTYETGSQPNAGTATSPSITVGFANPRLRFDSWHQTEDEGTSWDTKTVWLSKNGAAFENIFTVSGPANAWSQKSIDLSGAAGQSIRVEFRFDTIDHLYNNYHGWRLDNFQITEGATPTNAAPTPCFSTNPTSGYPGTWFTVNAGCTSDVETPAGNLYYQWDWESDGFYDTGYDHATSTGHSYNQPGTKTITLQVSDGVNERTTTRTVYVNEVPGSWFSDSFETGASNWEFSPSNFWHVTRTNAYTGSQSMWYGDETTLDYDTHAPHSGQFTSPAFTIPSGTSPYLGFKSWHHTESVSTHDKKLVQIVQSSSGAVLREWQLTPASQVWTSETFSLADFVGQSIRLRFKFDTVDAQYNDYRGWYIDDVIVQNGQPLPEQGDQSVRSFSSEWTHSNVQTSGFEAYRNDDGSIEAAYTFDGTGVIRKLIEIHLDSHKSASTAKIGVLANAATATTAASCSDGRDHTLYSIRVNGKQAGLVDPCVWSGSKLKWFNFSPQLLVEGFNTFDIVKERTVQSPDRGIAFDVDTGNPGTYSEIQIGSTHYSGELMWELMVDGQRSYETLERYVATEKKDQNGKGSTEFGQEVFVYYEPAKLNTLFTKTRQLPSGASADQWSSTVFEKNAWYSSSTMVSGWNHYEFDAPSQYESNQGRAPPTTGAYYSWFTTRAQTMDENGLVSADKYMQLVPSNPSAGYDRNCQNPPRCQNPPPSGKFMDDNGNTFELGLYAYWKTCRTAAQTGKANLDCIGFGAHLLDIDERFAAFAGAQQKGHDIAMWLADAMTQPSMSKWLKASLKITMQGSLTSWFYSFAQTGDVASVNVNERYHFGLAFTVLSIVPPVIGWQLPVNPQIPFHWVPTPPQQYNWYYP